MYFFNHGNTHKEYAEAYRKKYDRAHLEKYGGVRFSPLYLLRQDICYCLGFNPADPERKDSSFPEKFGPPIFASVILINIALTNIVKIFFDKNFPYFAKNYMGIYDPKVSDAIRFLRNALEHNSYALCYRYKDQEKGKANPKDKIYFGLIVDQKTDLLKFDLEWGKKHKSDLCNINPRGLLYRMEEALAKLQCDIQNGEGDLQSKFINNVRVKDWIIFKNG